MYNSTVTKALQYCQKKTQINGKRIELRNIPVYIIGIYYIIMIKCRIMQAV